jgi:hypothetical protein
LVLKRCYQLKKGRNNMFKVYSGYADVGNGTSRMGEIKVAPMDLILAFGKPGESDGYKVSGEYTFHDEESGVVFTMYDWKMTNLYDSNYPSPEKLWASTKPVTINIGGNHKGNIEEFKRLIKEHIQWVKTGKPFEKEVIGIAAPVGLFLTQKVEQ